MGNAFVICLSKALQDKDDTHPAAQSVPTLSKYVLLEHQ